MTTQPLTRPEDRRDVTARVIAVARADAAAGAKDQLHTIAGFDYGMSLAAGGRSQTELGDAAWMHLQNALYLVANEGHEGTGAERQARWFRLRDEIAEELDAYAARCRARRYTGWSNAARARNHPVRYVEQVDGSMPDDAVMHAAYTAESGNPWDATSVACQMFAEVWRRGWESAVTHAPEQAAQLAETVTEKHTGS